MDLQANRDIQPDDVEEAVPYILNFVPFQPALDFELVEYFPLLANAPKLVFDENSFKTLQTPLSELSVSCLLSHLQSRN
jgi:hypothetical protein